MLRSELMELVAQAVMNELPETIEAHLRKPRRSLEALSVMPSESELERHL